MSAEDSAPHNRSDVVVLGSANLDLIATVRSIPVPGETVLSDGRSSRAGGKGLNQAVAAARDGARTALVGAVGDDAAAGLLLEAAEGAGVDTTLVRRARGPSGNAWILVQADGENAIVVSSGANASVRSLHPAERERITWARVLVAQLETPVEAVLEAALLARESGARFVLNAAPALALPSDLLGAVDVLVVNEHEVRQLAGLDDPEEAAHHLLESVGAVVVTLGAQGALVLDHEGLRSVDSAAAQVVDTTGAGDAFTGVLAAALADGRTLDEAVGRAVVAGALAVETPGAVPSIPSRTQIDKRARMRHPGLRRSKMDPYLPRLFDAPTPVPLGPDDDLSGLDEAMILAAPQDPGLRPAWRDALHRWRREARARTAYDPAHYDHPDTGWASRAWNVAIVWLWDEVVRDWEHECFDVDRLLSAYGGPTGFGGLDAVVLWHAYPVIGVDERNQFDFYDVPGLVALVDGLHARGVRVFLDYNPWDTGTRRGAETDAVQMSALVDVLGADGVFLDTLKEADPALVHGLAALRPRPVLEGESRVPLIRIADHQASWAQWFADSATPGVLRARWFEQRHMMHHTRRWNRDHGEELRSAWVNGVGVLIWDVVFGVRVDWQDRDRALLRAMRTAYREHERYFTEGEWEPLTELAPEATAARIAGSRWRLDGRDLLTLVNVGPDAYRGPLLAAGAEIRGEPIPAGGIAGVLVDNAGVGRRIEYLDRAAQVPPVPGRTRSIPAPQRVIPKPAYGRAAERSVHLRPGVRELAITWRRRETGLYESAPYVDDWKPLPPRLHQVLEEARTVELSPVAVDAQETTNAEFAEFLAATGYRPAVDNRFLAHWTGGRPQPGMENAPVVNVDLADARAYARWRDARLPTEHEWQVAAGQTGFVRGEPQVWQWTESEHQDGRTRWVVLKGGSAYAAEGSAWYLGGGRRDPRWSVRLLLMQGGLSRSPRIGLRCAVDLLDEDTADDDVRKGRQ